MPASPSRLAQSFAAPAPLEPSLGDMLYDRAMQSLQHATPAASWAPPAAAPGAATGERRDPAAPEPRIGRDDIEQVAARVMRIIQREQRREREARGVF